MPLLVSDITDSRTFRRSLDLVSDTSWDDASPVDQLHNIFCDPEKIQSLRHLLLEKHEKIRGRQNTIGTTILTTTCLNRIHAVFNFLESQGSNIDQSDLDRDTEQLIDSHLQPNVKSRDHRLPLALDNSLIVDVSYAHGEDPDVTVRTQDRKTYLLKSPTYKKWEIYVDGEPWRVSYQNGNMVTAYNDDDEKRDFELHKNDRVVEDMERIYFHHANTLIYRGKSSSDGLHEVYIQVGQKRRVLQHKLLFSDEQPVIIELGGRKYFRGITTMGATQLLYMEGSGEDVVLTPLEQMIQLDDKNRPVFGRVPDEISDMTDFILGANFPDGKTILIDRRLLKGIQAYPTEKIQRLTQESTVD